MFKWITAYLGMIVFMFVIDLVWLSVIAKSIYQQGIGHLMAAEPNLVYAGLFYFVYVLGLLWFAIRPSCTLPGIKRAFVAGATIGFLVYASYDVTNLALLKDWPLGLSLMDISWGTLLSSISASVGKMIFDRFKVS